jgi:uncharacterized protein (TIGR02118 family)
MSMYKLIVLYPKPDDPEHFKKHYREAHVPLVKKIPGLKSYSYGYPATLDGNDPPHFCMFVGEFENAGAMQAAMGSAEGKAAVADIPNYSPKGATALHMESQ